MKIIFLGFPGCGKGTQAALISKKYNIPHISTGDLIRSLNDKTNKNANKFHEIISKGNFIDDDLMYQILKPHLKASFILDGFPRNLNQAKILGSNIDYVFLLNVRKEECILRIVNRNCGRVDDSREVAQRRMDIYDEETRPLIEYYKLISKLKNIDGEKNIDDVFKDITNYINVEKTRL